MIANRYRRHTREGLDCPRCGADDSLIRSRVRWYERARKLVSSKRPYRCHSCMFRLWLDPRKPTHALHSAARSHS